MQYPRNNVPHIPAAIPRVDFDIIVVTLSKQTKKQHSFSQNLQPNYPNKLPPSCSATYINVFSKIKLTYSYNKHNF